MVWPPRPSGTNQRHMYWSSLEAAAVSLPFAPKSKKLGASTVDGVGREAGVGDSELPREMLVEGEVVEEKWCVLSMGW